MPRAKKKKVAEVEAPPEEATEEEEPPPPPPPPSPPKKKAVTVAPESPSKSMLLKAQQKARKFVNKAQQQMRANLARSNENWETAGRIYDAKMTSLEKSLTRKPPPSLYGQLEKTHKVELDYQRARLVHVSDRYDAALDLAAVCEHEIAALTAHVHRLKRQLRVAKGPRWYRRGWSTTRVRFRL